MGLLNTLKSHAAKALKDPKTRKKIEDFAKDKARDYAASKKRAAGTRKTDGR